MSLNALKLRLKLYCLMRVTSCPTIIFSNVSDTVVSTLLCVVCRFSSGLLLMLFSLKIKVKIKVFPGKNKSKKKTLAHNKEE